MDVNEIIAAHYSAVRAEELHRIADRDRQAVWMITAFSAVVGFVFTQQFQPGLLILPVIILVFSAIYCHNDITIGALSLWLQKDYARMVDEVRRRSGLESEVAQWDGSFSNTAYYRSFNFLLRYIVIGVAVTVLSAVGVLLCYELSFMEKFDHLSRVLIWTYFAVFAALSSGLIAYAWSERVRQASKSDRARSNRMN